VGTGGNLEQTVTRNNMEAAEEIVRQLRLRDIGGIIVIDFIDMVLESNRDLVLRRLTECLGRDRTKHQVAEVTSLGLVQMTRKRVGQGLLEVFSEPCEHCRGRGVIVSTDPVDEKRRSGSSAGGNGGGVAGGGNSGGNNRRDRSGGSRDAKDGGKDVDAAPAEETSALEPVAGEEPAEGTRTGSRRNRGRRNRGQSGDDRAAEDAAVLAGVLTDVEPDTELHGGAEPGAEPENESENEPVTDAAGNGAVEQPAAVSNAVEIVPPLAETVPSVDGRTAEEVAVDAAGAETEAQPAEAPAAARPRRRRAASRPAGPPV
jgi:ribonuclease E